MYYGMHKGLHMQSGITRSASGPARAARYTVFAVLLASLEVLIDTLTWIQLDVAAIYGLPLLLAAMARNRRLLWALTAILTIATFAVYAAQVPGGAYDVDPAYAAAAAQGADDSFGGDLDEQPDQPTKSP